MPKRQKTDGDIYRQMQRIINMGGDSPRVNQAFQIARRMIDNAPQEQRNIPQDRVAGRQPKKLIPIGRIRGRGSAQGQNAG